MLIALLASALAAVLLIDRPAGADRPRVSSVLRARTIELVDGRGQVRAQIKVERPSREVVLRLRDQDGQVRVKLGASRAAPACCSPTRPPSRGSRRSPRTRGRR
jgi:hypothetical protein